jgi:hypothetical protein
VFSFSLDLFFFSRFSHSRAETKDLLADLLSLPRNAAVRKVNELVKRVRLVRAHAYIICHLREKMPMLFGKEDTKQDLIANLTREFKEIERVHKIPPGDFPDVRKMQELLQVHDFSSFESRRYVMRCGCQFSFVLVFWGFFEFFRFSLSVLDPIHLMPSDRLFQVIEQVMSVELPKLMKSLATPKASQTTNPFAESNWAITEGMKEGYDELFRRYVMVMVIGIVIMIMIVMVIVYVVPFFLLLSHVQFEPRERLCDRPSGAWAADGMRRRCLGFEKVCQSHWAKPGEISVKRIVFVCLFVCLFVCFCRFASYAALLCCFSPSMLHRSR